MSGEQLDVRALSKPDRHPVIFAAYNALAVGDSIVVVNDHDPLHLREEFDTDFPGSYSWEYVARGSTADSGDRAPWQVRITKIASTSLPRVLCNTAEIAATAPATTAGPATAPAGAHWALPVRTRDLDSNVVHLPALATIAAHTGPDLDVLVHVLSGSGELGTERDTVSLEPGALVWLPRRATRGFTAGPTGLTYLTVHRRRPALSVSLA